MQKTNIIHHWAFRLITPPVFALFIYVLVLLFFGSPDQLLTHFFSVEYLICVVLCYVNFGLWRFAIKICQQRCFSSLQRGIILQTSLTLAIGIAVTLLLLTLYFKLLAGLVNFQSELVIFSSLMGLSALLYNMVFYSQFLLDYQHQEIMQQQQQLKNEALQRWHSYQNRINPGLLYQGLEHLIGLAYHDKIKADAFLNRLSRLYRKMLDVQDEIIPIDKEFEQVKQLSMVLNDMYKNQLEIQVNKPEVATNYMVSGLALLQLQKIVSENIKGTLQPLKVNVEFKTHDVQFTFRENKKLNNPQNLINLEGLKQTLNWYTGNTIEKNKSQNGFTSITVPLINID